MVKRVVLPIVAGLFLLTIPAFAGTEWQTKSVSNGRGGEASMLMHVYAQSGIVRQEFVEVAGKNPLMEKGMYWLFKGDSSKIYIVNPDDKTYFAINLDSMMQFAGAMSKMMQTTITNPAVTIKELSSEAISGYQCKHIVITSSYDIEMKMMMMKVQSHVESNREIWATDALAMQDLAGAFKTHELKTGQADLDKLILLQMEKYKNLGFTLKSKTTTTTTRNNKTETTTTEMEVSNIASHALNGDLFKIPADYKEGEFGGMMNPGQQ